MASRLRSRAVMKNETTQHRTKTPLPAKATLLIAATGVALLLTGCETTGLSPRETGRGSYSHFVYQMAREQQPVAASTDMRKPIRLAVAQVGEVAPSTNILNRLKSNSDQIASVIALPLPSAISEPWDRHAAARQETPVARLSEIRSLARAMGADQVLIFGGSIDTRSSRNPLAILDVTIVGTAIFPSTEIHAEGKAAGILVDVATGAIRFQVDAEQTASGATPSAFAYEKKDSVRVKTRDALAANLADEFLRKLAQQ